MCSSWDKWGFLLFHTHFAVKVNAPFMIPSWALMLHFGNKVCTNYMVEYFVQLIILMKDLISLITLRVWFWAWVTVSATCCTATSKNGPHTESGLPITKYRPILTFSVTVLLKGIRRGGFMKNTSVCARQDASYSNRDPRPRICTQAESNAHMVIKSMQLARFKQAWRREVCSLCISLLRWTVLIHTQCSPTNAIA